MKEAFTSGKAGMVVEKLGNILGKRIGEPIIFSEVPIMYENAYGTFAGYLGSISNGRLYLKINFKLTSSDSITSVDFYNDDVSQPLYTVDMDGLNIVQIVNTIVEELLEDDEIDDRILESTLEPEQRFLLERGRPSKPVEDYIYIIDKWVEEDSRVLKDLQSKSLSDVYSDSFIKWVSDKPRYKEELKYYFFAKVVKMFLIGRGLTNKTFKKRKKGSQERQVSDPILQAQFEEVVENISWEEKFEFLRGAIAQMYMGDEVRSIFIYGDPGSGKTHEVTNTLEDLNAEYKIYKGGVKNTDDLIRILYNNREGTILVFDDFDSAIKKDPNIFKAILDNKPVRELTYVDVKRGKNMEDIPPKFEFTSGIIFISNIPKVDKAVASRSIVIELSLSNEEMIDKMEKTLEKYRPEVPMETKKKALDYAREIAPGVVSIDYRMMDNIIVAMKISKNWRKMSLLLMQSAA